MSEPYHQLLDATIQHLKDLKARGTRFVAVAPETVKALTQPVPLAGNPAAPARSLPPARPATASPVPRPITAAQTPPASLPNVATPAAPISPAPQAVPAPSSLAALTPADKTAAIENLRGRVLACVTCQHLASTRQKVVFGVGNINADLMFVGEAPGADEDRVGEPFVGAAGQLLTRIIQTMGLSRETVYIANILKCRPNTPPGTSGNRKPTPEEMNTCVPYLQEQIDLIRPKVIVALGATATEGLLNRSGISRLRGTWQAYRGIPLMPTFHPAYLLYRDDPGEKRRLWEDMLQVMEKLGMPISTKQRGYFLK